VFVGRKAEGRLQSVATVKVVAFGIGRELGACSGTTTVSVHTVTVGM
jgi:hypothetical protein